jgi:hypothetical protein
MTRNLTALIRFEERSNNHEKRNRCQKRNRPRRSANNSCQISQFEGNCPNAMLTWSDHQGPMTACLR